MDENARLRVSIRVMLDLALGKKSQLVKYPDLRYWIIGRDTKF